MSLPIIIISCLLLLIAYAFEVLSSRIKSPSVILMLLLGWVAQQFCLAFHVQVPDMNAVLPIFGTVGLILIVLEGSMELEMERSKVPMMKQSFFMALIPLLLLAFGLGFAFFRFTGESFKNCLANAIPFSIISSAIAIPSVRKLDSIKREFVTFESSLSDILGVMFFNFVALNDEINVESVELFIAQLVIIIIVTIISTIGISYMMTRINYHIKYIPILLMIILVYAVAKMIHLPGLIFVLLCGLFLGNIRHVPISGKLIRQIRPGLISENLSSFKAITVEFTFIIRVLFFVTFGFLIQTEEVLNLDSLPWALGIVAGIFLLRLIFLKFSRMELFPLLTVAPRGLITILLFYLLPESAALDIVNRSMVLQVILLTVSIMMLGVLLQKEKKQEEYS